MAVNSGRRSLAIRIGGAAFVSAALAGCLKDAEVFQDAAACSVRHPEPQCAAAAKSAIQSWLREDGFHDPVDCKLAEGVLCAQRPDGLFSAPMAGFVLDGNGEAVVWRDERRCDIQADGSRECHPVPSATGFYVGRSFIRPASAINATVETVSTERSAAAARAVEAAHEAAVEHGGFGDGAAGHGGGGGE